MKKFCRVEPCCAGHSQSVAVFACRLPFSGAIQSRRRVRAVPVRPARQRPAQILRRQLRPRKCRRPASSTRLSRRANKSAATARISSPGPMPASWSTVRSAPRAGALFGSRRSESLRQKLPCSGSASFLIRVRQRQYGGLSGRRPGRGAGALFVRTRGQLPRDHRLYLALETPWPNITC